MPSTLSRKGGTERPPLPASRHGPPRAIRRPTARATRRPREAARIRARWEVNLGVIVFHACRGLYSSVAERQSCKLKVLGSIPSEGCLALSRRAYALLGSPAAPA